MLFAATLGVFESLGIVDLMEAYLGEAPVISSNKAIYRMIEVPKFLLRDFHQDGRFMGGDIRAANLWITLDDCGEGVAPTLDLVPRRESCIHPTGQAKGFDWTITPDEVEAMVGPAGVARLDLAAGDAVFFDHYLVHRTAWGRNMPGRRRAIECWFFGASSCPEAYQPLAI